MRKILRQTTINANGDDFTVVAEKPNGQTETITVNKNDIVAYITPIGYPVTANVVNLMSFTNAEEGPADSFFFRAIGNPPGGAGNYERHTKPTLVEAVRSALRSHDIWVIKSYKGLGKFLRDKVNP